LHSIVSDESPELVTTLYAIFIWTSFLKFLSELLF
jgi:hypothetical protein